MFTIRHVEVDGTERIFAASGIEKTAPGELTFGCVIKTGKVYVMNDLGKTVGVYDCEAVKKEQKNGTHTD